MTPSVTMICNDCCSITFAASIAACATWSLSEPRRTSIDGTGSVSKREPGSRRYLSSTLHAQVACDAAARLGHARVGDEAGNAAHDEQADDRQRQASG